MSRGKTWNCNPIEKCAVCGVIKSGLPPRPLIHTTQPQITQHVDPMLAGPIPHKQQATQHQYPVWWDMSKTNLGGARDCDYGKPHLISLVGDGKDAIAQQIAQKFYQSSKNHPLYSQYYPNIQVIKVEGIQNQELYYLYQDQKRSLLKGARNINERDLWHGTTVDIIQKIMKQGFERIIVRLQHGVKDLILL